MLNEYLAARRSAIERYFSHMNPMQRKAVCKTEGPVLILAGAGSGKTTVLINRVANLLLFGRAYESEETAGPVTEEELAYLRAYARGEHDDTEGVRPLIACRPVEPWRVLAITFTNKAAGELKSRLAAQLGPAGEEVSASTFHSACVRILRREIGALGYASSFTIYDTDDSLRVIKEILKAGNIDEKRFAPRSVLSFISQYKDSFRSLEEFGVTADHFYLNTCAKIYTEYQRRLKAANALDFDDIIVQTVRLFQEHPDVLEKYQNYYRYIMVDEYQDTNNAQYLLVSLLARKYQNLCVVGDDDQSIYKFRGATIENILSFERQFPGATVIRLEQNYRCTQKILDAANAVIANNTQRKGKNLWTENETGELIQAYTAQDEMGEARFIADTVLEAVKDGAKFSDHAVLYRMNAQANTIERALVKSGVPYRIIGGLRFYERKEIRDILAYLQVINNPADNLRLRRIINEPRRGIGDSTLAAAGEIADALGLSLYEVLSHAEEYAPIAARRQPLQRFCQMMDHFIAARDSGAALEDLLDLVLTESGYQEALLKEGPEGQGRLENIEELKSNMVKFEEENEDGGLAEFLEEISLYTDLDNYDPDTDAVTLMTLHSAKGLEFPTVFIAGMEEGVFPGMQAILNPEEVEEERRLAYVGITRAKKHLYLTMAQQRLIYGKTNRNRSSRFVREIPKALLHETGENLTTRRLDAAPAQRERKVFGRELGVGAGAPQAGSAGSFAPGDRVRHRTFGEGMVLSATPMGGDHLLEIAFDSVGTKKIMANFARLTKA